MNHRTLALGLVGLSACQILNPAFGLDLGVSGGESSTTDASAGTLTEPVPTTSSPTTLTTTTDTSAGPGTSQTGDITSTSGVVTTGTDTGTTEPVDTEPPPAGCGDGVVAGDEQCDDGDDDDHDECTNACKFAVCGDGVVQDGEEQCDDGVNDGSACTPECLLPACGDGVVNGGEQCDDGNDGNFDTCPNDCVPSCGDGLFQPDKEECDPTADKFLGNVFTPLCNVDCTLHTCFRMNNTAGEELIDLTWFDACANADGERIAVMVRDSQEVRYFATGQKPPMSAWTADTMTSTTTPDLQWKLSGHVFKVQLADFLIDKPGAFDSFYAFGRNSTPDPNDLFKCGSSLGDGYAFAVMPEQNYVAARLIVMPHLGSSGKRNLAGWDQAGPAIELAFAGGEGMYLCEGMPLVQPFLGEVTVSVF